MNRIKKIIPLLVVFIMVFLIVPVSTHAQSTKTKKSAVNKTVNTFFTSAKKLNCKKMEKCFVPAGVVIFDERASLCNVIRPWSGKLTWRIKSTKINGDKAKVAVQANYMSIANAYFAMWWKTSFLGVEAPEKNPAKEIWLKKYKMKLLGKCLKKYTPDKITSNLQISLQRKNGKWKITKATDRLLNVVYCDLFLKGKSEKEYDKDFDHIADKVY